MNFKKSKWETFKQAKVEDLQNLLPVIGNYGNSLKQLKKQLTRVFPEVEGRTVYYWAEDCSKLYNTFKASLQQLNY